MSICLLHATDGQNATKTIASHHTVAAKCVLKGPSDAAYVCRECRGGWIYRKISWYVADIDNTGIVSYQRFRYRFYWYINIVWVTSEISVISRYFIILFRLFNANWKTRNYMSKTEYLIWQPRYTSTSLKRKLRNKYDVIELTTMWAIMNICA